MCSHPMHSRSRLMCRRVVCSNDIDVRCALMEIIVRSTKSVKPAYGGSDTPATGAAAAVVPLTVFDEANYDEYISGIQAFHPPASPPNAVLEAGLAAALAEYREWAGRLVAGAGAGAGAGRGRGRRGILLNDAGARLVEATADVALDGALPLQPTPETLRLHPCGGDGDELLLVQLTRFACGSLVVGYTMHHAVADGFGACNFLLAWGQCTRGAAIDPVPVHDRVSFFLPRDPPRVEFEHRGVEFKPCEREIKEAAAGDAAGDADADEVVVHKLRFSREFISELKSRACAGAPGRPYSTVQCVVAQVWRCITKARGLDVDGGGEVTTGLRLAVNGRAKMNRPRVPEGYTGNAVLWARPATAARELVVEPLQHAAELVRRALAGVDDGYFRSFVDFASSGAVEEERLVPTADVEEMVLSPDVEVDCLLRAPFYDLDFGGGRPFLFMPGYHPAEGVVYILPASPLGDGSVEVLVSLFSRDMETFKECCYSLAPQT
ncbi:hypothetical protein ACP4OV_014098 [Aristida adscensionis]